MKKVKLSGWPLQDFLLFYATVSLWIATTVEEGSGPPQESATGDEYSSNTRILIGTNTRLPLDHHT